MAFVFKVQFFKTMYLCPSGLSSVAQKEFLVIGYWFWVVIRETREIRVKKQFSVVAFLVVSFWGVVASRPVK